MKTRALAALVAVALAGCTVGPDYVRPVVDTPASWRIDYPKAADVANAKWWEQFGDPVLDELVETALRENRDIRVAAARVDQFLGTLDSTRSQLFPQFGYGADVSRARASQVGQPPLPPGADPYFTLYQGSLGASWQLDLFGRVRRLSEAAQAQVYASEQAQRGVVLSVVSAVASSYIGLRALDRQLEIAQATAANFGETARIFELRFKAGVVSQTEVVQIRSQYQQALAAIPAFQQQIAAQENLISILLGRNPGPIARGKTIDQLVAPLIPGGPPVRAAAAPAGHPAGRAESRRRQRQHRRDARALLPDDLPHRRARQRQHGVRQLPVRPRERVAAGREPGRPDLHLRRHRRAGALGGGAAAAGGVLLPAHGAERIPRNERRADRHAAQDRGSLEQQAERVAALREFARLSKLKFDKGVAGYLEVLVAENELFAAELASVRLLADRYVQVVNVYQAMGGGWVTLADSIAVPPTRRSAAAKSDRQTRSPEARAGTDPPRSGAANRSRASGPLHLSGSPPSAGAPGSGCPCANRTCASTPT